MGKEKKEIGMEKLIELLNEYEVDKDFRDYEWRIERKTKERMCGTEIMGMSGEQFTGAYVNTEEMERIIISKKYGFIKWLVENEKIAYDIPNNSDLYRAFELACISLDNADYITMLLAIQDEPIRFLCEILK